MNPAEVVRHLKTAEQLAGKGGMIGNLLGNDPDHFCCFFPQACQQKTEFNQGHVGADAALAAGLAAYFRDFAVDIIIENLIGL